MGAEERERRWLDVWKRGRQRCIGQEEVARWRAFLPPEAHRILEEARTLAGVADPAMHAEAEVERLIDRVNALGGQPAVLLHGPVCNGLSMLRCAAQEVLAARAGTPDLGAALRAPAAGAQPAPGGGPRGRQRFEWFMVAGDGEELVALAEECALGLTPPLPVSAAPTLEDALECLARRPGSGIIVVNLTMDSGSGRGAHGLEVAREARRRHHAVVLVTAAVDYLGFWPRLASAGLTGHDVVIKTRRDFASRLRQRAIELVQPAERTISYDDETGHVVRIGDAEIAEIEAQEALVLRALDRTWRTPAMISDACRDTDLAPNPGGVPPLISVLRRKLERALVQVESSNAPGDVIERRRRDGMPVEYRLASWLRWVEPPEPVSAPRSLPAVVVIEDDPDWGRWVVQWLDQLEWPTTIAATAERARQALDLREPLILVADLALVDPVAGIPDPEIGLRLIEDVAGRHPHVRVIVLSAFGGRDRLRARLFSAGVRTVDVIDKAYSRDECRAVLHASLQRAADEMWRGVRRPHEPAPAHRLVRLERRRIEVDGRPVRRLSPGEAQVLDVLIRRPNQPVTAELIEYECFSSEARPHSAAGFSPLNKVQSAVSQLRSKIDAASGAGVGKSVVRTSHHGARSAYQLRGLVTDYLAEPGRSSHELRRD